MPAARRDHVFWGDHPMSPTCIRRLGSCCYGQSHSEWWELFKSPKTSVTLESLAWNMLVHWLVGSPAWVLTYVPILLPVFSNQICLSTVDSRCCFNPCDSGLKQTKTKSSSEVLHFRLQLSWSLHLSGELCEGCCIPLETELVEETTVPVKPRFITLQETNPTLVRKRTKGTHMHQPQELRLSKNCVLWFV